MNCEVAPDRDNLHLVRPQSSMRLFPHSSPCLQFLEYMSGVHLLSIERDCLDGILHSFTHCGGLDSPSGSQHSIGVGGWQGEMRAFVILRRYKR